MMRRLTCVLVAMFACVGCARQTVIESEPPGARVSIARQFVGYTPLTLHVDVAAGPIRVEADGYTAVQGPLQRRFDKRSLLALLVPPLLLVPTVSLRPMERYHVQLQPGKGTEQVDVLPGAR